MTVALYARPVKDNVPDYVNTQHTFKQRGYWVSNSQRLLYLS